MKKTLVLAALVGGLFSAAPLPVQAASSIPAKCLILPLLQADCRAAISDALSSSHDAVVKTVDSSSVVDGLTRFPSPWYWVRCKPASEGKYLLECH